MRYKAWYARNNVAYLLSRVPPCRVTSTGADLLHPTHRHRIYMRTMALPGDKNITPARGTRGTRGTARQT